MVGFGMAGRVFHAPLISSVEGLELAAVVERNSSKAAERYPGITTYRSVDELLADSSIKLVVVATPNSSHFRIASQALGAAKSVVVDKPVALSSSEIAQLNELAGGIGLRVFPFHNRRFDSDFLTIRKLMDEHSLGRLVHFESTFDAQSVQQRGRSADHFLQRFHPEFDNTDGPRWDKSRGSTPGTRLQCQGSRC